MGEEGEARRPERRALDDDAFADGAIGLARRQALERFARPLMLAESRKSRTEDPRRFDPFRRAAHVEDGEAKT